MSGFISDFFSDAGEFIAEAHTEFANLRSKAYKQNFFLPGEGEYNIDETLLTPTPLEEQYNFLEPYSAALQPVHDLYSIIYKPVTLILFSLNVLRTSMVYGLEALASLFQSVISLIPLPALETELAMPEREESSLDSGLKSIVLLLGSVYLLGVCLPLDAGSAVISIVSRSMITIGSAFADGLDYFKSDEESASMTYTM